MLQSIDSDDFQGSFDRRIDETSHVMDLIMTFVGGFMVAVARRYLGNDVEALISEENEIDDAPDIGDVRIPFFMETTSLRNPDSVVY